MKKYSLKRSYFFGGIMRNIHLTICSQCLPNQQWLINPVNLSITDNACKCDYCGN